MYEDVTARRKPILHESSALHNGGSEKQLQNTRSALWTKVFETTLLTYSGGKVENYIGTVSKRPL